MLQRLAQFCVALLQFLEQPHVFDGDDGLIGEGLEKLDLLIRETDGLPCGEWRSTPIGRPLTQQRAWQE